MDESTESETPAGRARLGASNQPPSSHGWVKWLVILALGFGAWYYRAAIIKHIPTAASVANNGSSHGGRGRGGANAVVPVVVAVAKAGSIPVYLRNVGTVTPANTVTLHTRVDGQIVNVDFQEGQLVHAGDPLVQIDPRPYQVALAQAQGQLGHDQALLTDAKIDAARYQSLYDQSIIPKQQLDTQTATVNEYQGALSSDQAQIDSAKLNLTYCTVTAPLTGRIGLRLVDPGNIVHAADTNGLAVITQVQPIAVLFSLPEDNLQQVFNELRDGEHPDVDAFDRTGTKQLASGKLLTIDNTIDTTTGTYRLKAMFDNSDNALFPNQFVNMRLLVGDDSGLTIVPPAAIQRGPQGTYVFVVDSSDKVDVEPVTVKITEGEDAGLSTGLKPGEQVVVDGADKLEQGTTVVATLQGASPAAPGGGAPAAAVATAADPPAPANRPASGHGRGRHGGRGAAASGRN